MTRQQALDCEDDMNLEKRIPPTVCETVSGVGEQLSLPDVLLSETDFSTGWSASQGISALLLVGEVNALPLSYLVKITGLDQREVRARIQKERLAGVPILANNQTGYYLPADDAERDRCVKSMLHRAAEITASARAIQKGGRRL